MFKIRRQGREVWGGVSKIDSGSYKPSLGSIMVRIGEKTTCPMISSLLPLAAQAGCIGGLVIGKGSKKVSRARVSVVKKGRFPGARRN